MDQSLVIAIAVVIILAALWFMNNTPSSPSPTSGSGSGSGSGSSSQTPPATCAPIGKFVQASNLSASLSVVTHNNMRLGVIEGGTFPFNRIRLTLEYMSTTDKNYFTVDVRNNQGKFYKKTVPIATAPSKITIQVDLEFGKCLNDGDMIYLNLVNKEGRCSIAVKAIEFNF